MAPKRYPQYRNTLNRFYLCSCNTLARTQQLLCYQCALEYAILNCSAHNDYVWVNDCQWETKAIMHSTICVSWTIGTKRTMLVTHLVRIETWNGPQMRYAKTSKVQRLRFKLSFILKWIVVRFVIAFLYQFKSSLHSGIDHLLKIEKK